MASIVASDVVKGNLRLRSVLGVIAIIDHTGATFSDIDSAHPIFDKGITFRALFDIINRAFKNDSVVVHLAASRLERYDLLV